MKLTGNRLVKRDELLTNARRRVITWDVYRHQLAILERREAAVQERIAAKEKKAEEERQKRIQELLEQGRKLIEASRKKREEKKKAAAEKRKATLEAKRAVGSVSFSNDIPYLESREFFQLLKKNVGKTVEITATLKNEKVGPTVLSEIYTIANSTFHSFFNFVNQSLEGGSEAINQFVGGSTASLKLVPKVEGKKMKQAFKEGSVNCFLGPVIDYLKGLVDLRKTVQSKKKIEQVVRRAVELEEKYRWSGITEDEMGDVCKTLNISVKLVDTLNNRLAEFNPSSKWSLTFYNTRANHVEMGELVLKGEPVEVSEMDMKLLISRLKREGKFFMTQGKIKELPELIRTLDGSYKLRNEKSEIINAMNDSIGLYDLGVDGVKHPELVKFFKAAYLVNAVPVHLQNQENAVCHLDMKNAYTKFKQCPYYQGFFKVWKWAAFKKGVSREFVEKHVGVYKFKVVNVYEEVLEKLGLCVGNYYVLPSPELLCLIDLGIDVKIVAGAWGGNVDFDFTTEMIDSGLFREWSGKLGMDYKEKVYNFPGTQEFAEHIKANNNEVDVFYKDGMIRVAVMKKKQPTFFHIASFITSYTRINMLLKMKEIGFENVVKVVLDGLFTSVKCEADGLFREKPMKSHHNSCSNWYTSYSDMDEIRMMCSDWTDDGVYGNTFLAGAGGTGKTYSVLNGQYNDVLYVSPTRMLGFKMNSKTGCNWTTLHKLVGMDGDNKKVRTWTEENNHVPAVLLIDELTMQCKSFVEKAVEMYPRSMILLAGDMEGKMWFQTRNGDGKTWSEIYDVSGWTVKTFTTDYRAKDSTLKEFKLALRQKMREVFTDGGRENTKLISDWVSENVQMIGFWDAVLEWKAGDMWIAPTHEISERLLKNDVCSGYRMKHSGKGTDGVFRSKGEFVDFDVGSGCEKRGSITTHSSQGLTIGDRKIFISVYGSFDFSMLYTAVSRAENWDQLVFVGY